jgi:hypothetical protein
VSERLKIRPNPGNSFAPDNAPDSPGIDPTGSCTAFSMCGKPEPGGRSIGRSMGTAAVMLDKQKAIVINERIMGVCTGGPL